MNEHREEGNIIDRDRDLLLEQVTHQKERFLRPIDTARRLKSLLWQEFELSRMTCGWMPAIPDYEVKIELGRLSYLHNKNVRLLQDRINELPGGLGSKEWTPAITRETYERLSLAPDGTCFFAGYLYMLQRLFEEYEELDLRLDPLLDAPTIDQLNIIFLHRQRTLEWVKRQIRFAGVDQPDDAEMLYAWRSYVIKVWDVFSKAQTNREMPNTSGIAWPLSPAFEPAGPVPVETRLDPRFPEYISSPKYKKAYSDPDMSPLIDSVKQMHFINATEMGAAENLAYLYYGVQHMPLDFFYDLSRHLWDEVRHFQMGVRRLHQLGYSTEQFKFFKGGPGKEMDETWYADMYANLTMVAEPCSFIKKRKSAEAFWAFGDALSAIHCEFDMVDERMHVDFGKKWGPELYKTIRNDMITAQQLSERARKLRFDSLDAVQGQKIDQVIKNFPAFCGFSTSELNYSNY